MKMRLSALLLLAAITIPNAYAADKPEAGCEWQGQNIELGEQVFSKDLDLAEAFQHALIAGGMDVEEAKEFTENDDWMGYTLRCSRAMHIDAETKQLVAGDYVMVLAETHESHYYDHNQLVAK